MADLNSNQKDYIRLLNQFIAILSIVISFILGALIIYATNFLIKRRKKEFGLYNILGMEKSNLACVLLFESLIISAISLVGGLTAGIAFSKLSELCMIKLMKAEVDFGLRTEPEAAKILNKMGRSYWDPAFFTLAGAKFTVIRLVGKCRPLFLAAARTRSRASFTAASGRPTMSKPGSPLEI